ncbi:heparan-sulfate 6-O-sulfotransferase 3-B isoform X2 [Electrophorus electricus]|uniref:heparan-sulfate 6-O-sulfotransferase 3-B isoform X2 n=1 Tax=Electrophorus electricus TaxID=8005 RepID=UPI0015D0718A|nr:heparan-sulfate 6-O-sulfotransferase 3-B isoform X2 [Electrophorus electricus]XP_035385838.1 heparan-sulfate 6-O-sulfotransferase 3-B isoform X2 [Electrophorus electricus]
MDDKSNKLFFIPVLAVLFVMIGYQYICPAGSTSCRFRTGQSSIGLGFLLSKYSPRFDIDIEAQDTDEDGSITFQSKFNFTLEDLERHVDFDIKGNDVIVFLHIQKTGGTTFGRHLVRNIKLERPCDCKAGQKKCTCHRPGKAESWLFSRFSTGWSCGLHADWTELTNCVPAIMNKKQRKDAPLSQRNLYYITLLRDPVSRYLSEWKHVQRGATWKTAIHMCDGRPPTPAELPACYNGADWTGVSLAEFMACPSNLASNRQTRMLADLSLVGCYNLSSMSTARRAELLLGSAKRNLRRMAFFGLTEFQRKTQLLFECTFGLRFMEPFTQLNSTRAGAVGVGLAVRRYIEHLNALDVQLYEYARELFVWRVQRCRRRLRERRREQRRARREQRVSRARQCEKGEL